MKMDIMLPVVDSVLFNRQGKKGFRDRYERDLCGKDRQTTRQLLSGLR
jgi:hypothetical protein